MGIIMYMYNTLETQVYVAWRSTCMALGKQEINIISKTIF